MSPHPRRCAGAEAEALFDDAVRVCVGDCAHQQLRLGRPGPPRYPIASWSGRYRWLCQLGLAGLRQHRPSLQLRLHRDRHVAGDGREACRHWLAVPVDAARRQRRLPRRRQKLSPPHPAEHPGAEFLVSRGLRRRQPLDLAQRPAVPVGEHVHRPRRECGWLHRPRLRARGAQPYREPRPNLDPDHARQGLGSCSSASTVRSNPCSIRPGSRTTSSR